MNIEWVFLVFFCSSFNVLCLSPPVIEVLLPASDQGDAAGRNMIKFQNTTHIMVIGIKYKLKLRCSASYPVKWSLQSLEQTWTWGVWAERNVKDFYDNSTYTYSMILQISMEKMSYSCREQPQVYECVAVHSDNMNVNMTVNFEETGPTCQVNPMIPSRESKLTMELTPEGNVTCCLQPTPTLGLNESFTSATFVMYRIECETPMVCLTERGKLGENYINPTSHWSADTELSPKCRTVKAWLGRNPALHVCHLRTDKVFTRDEYTTHRGKWSYPKYKPLRHLNYSHNEYFLQVEDAESYANLYFLNKSKPSDCDHCSRTTFESLNENSTKVFYNGQVSDFICGGSGFFYARRVIWELSWANGSSVLYYNVSTWAVSFEGRDYINEDPFKIKIMVGLTKITCYIPFWNSGEWTKLSYSPNIQDPKPPSSAEGETLISEDVEFVGGKSAELVCDLDGLPPAKYFWTLSSCIFNFKEGNRSLQAYHICPDDDKDHKSTFQIEAGKILAVILPQKNFNLFTKIGVDSIEQNMIYCTATNFAGNATKMFSIRVIRPTAPVIKATDPTRVMFFGDQHVALNCSILAGLPTPEIYWRKEGQNISSMLDKYNVEQYNDKSILMVKSVDYSTEGKYTCVASNVAGTEMRNFNILVKERMHSHLALVLVALLVLTTIALIGCVAYLCLLKSKQIAAIKIQTELSNRRTENWAQEQNLGLDNF